MRECLVFAALAGIVLQGMSAPQGAADAGAFTSVKQAYTAWAGAGGGSGDRDIAFAWMVARARSCPPQELAEAFSSLRRAAAADGRGNDFLAVCTARGGADADEVSRQTVALQLSDWHAAAEDHAAAAAALTDHLALGNLPTALRAVAARKAAQILVDRLGRVADAAAVLAAAMPPDPAEDPAAFADLAVARAALLHGPLGDSEGAAAEVQRVLALESSCPITPFAAAAERLAAIRAAAGKQDEAAAALILVFGHLSGTPPAGSACKLIDAGANAAALEEALGLLRTAVSAPFATPAELQTRVDRLQPEAVDLLLALGRAEEAVRECRALAFTTSDRLYPQAIELAARCLKAVDGDLGRANALLAFHAPEMPPGAVNPLLAFPPLDDPARTAACTRPDPAPGDWQGWLSHAALLSWADRPAAAMEASRVAFACCPMSGNNLQSCADAVARPVLVATRDSALGQRLADYLLYGSAGPDGAAGTGDDLDDPFPEARRRLTYAKSSVPPEKVTSP